MRISAETLGLRPRVGDRGAIRILAEAGFDCVDYSMDHMVRDDCILNGNDYRVYAKELRAYGESLGITFNQAHAPFAFRWDDEVHVQNVAIPRTIRSMEIASILGIPNIIIHPIHEMGFLRNMQRIWEINLDFFRKLLPYAHEYGVNIALENLFEPDGRGVFVHDTCSVPERYVMAMEALDDPHIVACIDVGHALLLGDDPGDLIRALGHERVKCLHVHDNCQVVDDHTLPYLGKMNWENVARALADIRYSGDFTFESFLFYRNFEDDFLPTAASWIVQMGRYLAAKIERYEREA